MHALKSLKAQVENVAVEIFGCTLKQALQKLESSSLERHSLNLGLH